jgi:hypothetical protein
MRVPPVRSLSVGTGDDSTAILKPARTKFPKMLDEVLTAEIARQLHARFAHNFHPALHNGLGTQSGVLNPGTSKALTAL